MKTIEHRFVEYIPDVLEDEVLYITMEYRTAVHKCICGCGNKVVTPISPKFWKLTYDGKGITLYPSIGNWNFPCQSHYWIKDSKIEFAPQWYDSKTNILRQPTAKVETHKNHTVEEIDKVAEREAWLSRIWKAFHTKMPFLFRK